MIRSVLIQPLVKPLVGSTSPGLARRTALNTSRIVATCLAVTALHAVATTANAAARLPDDAPKPTRPTERCATPQNFWVGTLGVIEGPRVSQEVRKFWNVAADLPLGSWTGLPACRKDDDIVPPRRVARFDFDACDAEQPRGSWCHAYLSHAQSLRRARELGALFLGSDPSYRLFGSGVFLSGISVN